MNLWARLETVSTGLAEELAAGRWKPAGSLLRLPYVVFDTETTGFQPGGGDEVISLAAVNFQTGAEFSTLVNPGRPIPPLITDLTGITEKMVAAAPPLETALVDFFHFVGRSVLVAHCAEFDRAFLEVKLRRVGRLRWVHPTLDTQVLAAFLFPTWRDYRLEHCASLLQTPVEGRHTALGDARTTAHLLEVLLDEGEQRGLRTWEQMNQFVYHRLW